MTRIGAGLWGQFQFTPLREGRHVHGGGLMALTISIHAPPRGATDYGIRVGGAFSFQFTPLREGRRLQSAIERDVSEISIHAPPRGATDDVMNALKPILFQFTPLREGRRRRHGFN